MDTLDDTLDDLPPPYSPNDPLKSLSSTTTPTFTSSSSSSSSSSSKLYHFSRNADNEYRITLEGRWAAYFAETHSGSFLHPHLIVRTQDAHGVQLAHCKYGVELITCDVGVFQAPGVKRSIAWNKMQRDTSQGTIMYRFAADVPAGSRRSGESQSPTTPTVLKFVWKRADTMMLVEEETRLVAAVASDVNCLEGKCAKLDVTTRYGKEFMLMAVTTFLAIYDSNLRDLRHRYHEHQHECCCEHPWERSSAHRCEHHGRKTRLVDGGILGQIEGPRRSSF